jgi:tRNA pseudouridine55 synthase
MTSRRAGQAVARCLGRKLAAGHAGTLDPAATGVLPVAIGGATRLVELLAGLEKEYRGTVRLGWATDTDDAQGRPLGEECPVEVSREEVEAALGSFRGEVMQRPPDFSAIKRAGRAAHRLARGGGKPELEPRPAVYRELELLRFEPPEVEVRALVSKGTYIRALARDLGKKLGCGGHLAALRRTRAGSLSIEDAVGLDELRALAAGGRAGERLLPAREALPGLPCLTAGDELLRSIRRGQRRPLADFAASAEAPPAGARCLLLDAAGRALALAEIVDAGDGELLVQPRKRIR